MAAMSSTSLGSATDSRPDTSGAQRLLIACAATSFAIGLLHVACLFTGEATARFFAAPTPVLEMVRQKSLLLIPVCLAIAGGLSGFALYAWSGAGRMRRLPLLRTGLLLIGAIYTLRGLLLLPQLMFATRNPGKFPTHFLVFSAVSLALGVAHLAGTWGRWRELTPGSDQID